MCKFFANDVFYDQHFDDTEYFIRMDTDSFFLNVRKIFIKKLSNLNSDYAYLKNTIQYEDKSVTLGFGHCLYDYIRKEKNLKNFNEHKLKICNQATLKPKIFYTNFEVIKLKWAKSIEHKNLLNYIIKKSGIYKYRWGDALIRYYCVKLLCTKTSVLRGCLYKHSGLYDSRNLFQILLSKIYSKITNKLHKNSYEKKFNSLDKIFLGIN